MINTEVIQDRDTILSCVKYLTKAFAYSATIFVLGCQMQPEIHRDTRFFMGTYVEVASTDTRAADIVFNEIKRLEGLLSKYDSQSEVSAFNNLGKISAGSDLYYLLIKSKEFWFATDGAFDITVGPLMDLWGFTDKKYRLPQDDEIKKVLGLIGSNKIIFHPSNNVVEFNVSGMKIDLGAIAKGYALDCAVCALRAAGVRSCLINAGGQIYCLGKNADKPWRITIQDPRRKEPKGHLDLVDKAVAISSDYEQYFIVEGKRFSGVMDPKTGYPSDSGVIWTTVIADNGLTADFLATSFMVMGKDKGMELLKRYPGVEAKILEQ